VLDIGHYEIFLPCLRYTDRNQFCRKIEIPGRMNASKRGGDDLDCSMSNPHLDLISLSLSKYVLSGIALSDECLNLRPYPAQSINKELNTGRMEDTAKRSLVTLIDAQIPNLRPTNQEDKQNSLRSTGGSAKSDYPRKCDRIDNSPTSIKCSVVFDGMNELPSIEAFVDKRPDLRLAPSEPMRGACVLRPSSNRELS
jgi:hypothetical protein